MKRTSPSWTSSLENQRCLVSCNVTCFQWNLWLFCSRIRKISKDDLVGLHLRLWRHLRTLPWNQLRLRRWDPLLVLHQALQEVLIQYQHKSVSICNIFQCTIDVKVLQSSHIIKYTYVGPTICQVNTQHARDATKKYINSWPYLVDHNGN